MNKLWYREAHSERNQANRWQLFLSGLNSKHYNNASCICNSRQIAMLQQLPKVTKNESPWNKSPCSNTFGTCRYSNIAIYKIVLYFILFKHIYQKSELLVITSSEESTQCRSYASIITICKFSNGTWALFYYTYRNDLNS